MNTCIKKIIRASAGTGKTYRLSLEYIGLLLQFRRMQIHYSEILVITFTRKATAEIRERIFKQLDAITRGSDEGVHLRHNMCEILNITVSEDDIAYLTHVYHDMLINKNQVQISTIDSFINKIFRTVIAPYLGITDYTIDDTVHPETYATIFQGLFNDTGNLDSLKHFFTRTGFKEIKLFKKFIDRIIQHRWHFQFLDQWQEGPVKARISEAVVEENWKCFSELYGNALDVFQDHVAGKRAKGLSDVMVKDAVDLFIDPVQPPPVENLAAAIKTKLSDKKFIGTKHKKIFALGKFWNAGRCFTKKDHPEKGEELLEKIKQAKEHLAEYLFATELLNEEKEIIAFARLVIGKYDDIKFREKIFKHDDITYYTFRYLYDPELSLVEHNSVSNAFYEILSTLTRFVLVDEFQDTSIIQFKILLPIISELISGSGAKEYGGVIVVGDEKQSIYGWRQGERDLLLKMPDILIEPEQTRLTVSYRSRPVVLNFINSVFSHPDLHKKLNEENIVWPYDPVSTAVGISDDIHTSRAPEEAGHVRICFRNYSKNDNDISQQQEAIREFIQKEFLPVFRARQLSLKDTVILTRRNDDLAMMANVLNDAGIPYVLESSRSIVDHRAIKPLLVLCHFFAFFDAMDLLKFLRSDVVLMHPIKLKQVLLALRDIRTGDKSILYVLENLDQIPEIAKLLRLFEKSNSSEFFGQDLLSLSRSIIEEYNVVGIFNTENDIKNLHFFLEIVAGFDNNTRDYSHDLTGFLKYCTDFRDDNSLQQRGLGEINAVKLLSIHKAKGLEFDSVFVYWNLSSRSGNSSGHMNIYQEYQPDYSGIRDCVLTFNFDSVIPLSHARHLEQNRTARTAIEELNNFYVAITRAKSDVLIYFSYEKAGGLEQYFVKDPKEKINVDSILAATVYQAGLALGVLHEENKNACSISVGVRQIKTEQQTADSPHNFTFINKYLDTHRTEYLRQDSERLSREMYLDFKTLYIRHRNTDRGNVAHYYLSFITYGAPEERRLAHGRTIAFYGSLLPVPEVEALIQKLDRFIDDHHDLFSQEKWSKVLTEYTLYSPQGEVRIDRLLIDEKSRQVLVIDYKTGEGYTRDQILDYVHTIQSLPVVKNEGYEVRGEYMEVEI
jgi:ATP-dependent exoDNAse (exonuclease V) beta subunit